MRKPLRPSRRQLDLVAAAQRERERSTDYLLTLNHLFDAARLKQQREYQAREQNALRIIRALEE